MTKLLSLKINVCLVDMSRCQLDKHYSQKKLCLIGHGQNTKDVFRFFLPVLKNLTYLEVIGVHFKKEEDNNIRKSKECENLYH